VSDLAIADSFANSDICIECHRDTSFGSGLFVNRIPADNGYICPECFVCPDCGVYYDDCECREDY